MHCRAGERRPPRARALGAFLPATTSREKIVGLAVQTFVLCAVSFLVVLTGFWFELHLGIWNMVTATSGVWLLGIDFGLLAMGIGAATGNRGLALGISSAVAAASYLLSSMAPVVSWLDPAKYASLFYYAVGNNQLGEGLGPGAFAVLAGAAAALTLVTIRIFESHDLTA